MLRPHRHLNSVTGCRLGGTFKPQHAALTWPNVTMRNGGFGRLSAAPSGYGAVQQGGILLAVTDGSLATYKRTLVQIDASAIGAIGRAMEATTSITINADAVGGLVTSGSAIAAITINASGEISAVLAGVASASIVIGAVADVSCLLLPTADAVITITATGELMNLCWMEATTADSGLTPDGIANAVGKLMIEAGPNGSFTLIEALRFVLARSVGLLSGGPNTPNIKAPSDHSKTRIAGVADSDGNRTSVTLDAS